MCSTFGGRVLEGLRATPLAILLVGVLLSCGSCSQQITVAKPSVTVPSGVPARLTITGAVIGLHEARPMGDPKEGLTEYSLCAIRWSVQNHSSTRVLFIWTEPLKLYSLEFAMRKEMFNYYSQSLRFYGAEYDRLPTAWAKAIEPGTLLEIESTYRSFRQYDSEPLRTEFAVGIGLSPEEEAKIIAINDTCNYGKEWGSVLRETALLPAVVNIQRERVDR